MDKQSLSTIEKILLRKKEHEYEVRFRKLMDDIYSGLDGLDIISGDIIGDFRTRNIGIIKERLDGRTPDNELPEKLKERMLIKASNDFVKKIYEGENK